MDGDRQDTFLQITLEGKNLPFLTGNFIKKGHKYEVDFLEFFGLTVRLCILVMQDIFFQITTEEGKPFISDS